MGINIPPARLERFWQMCVHSQGQVLNRSGLGESLGVCHHTINNYVALLEKISLLRVLQFFHANVKRRLIKSPKFLKQKWNSIDCAAGQGCTLNMYAFANGQSLPIGL